MELKETWKNSFLYKEGKVCLVDTDYLYEIRNEHSTEYTDNLEGKVVHIDELWDDILNNGMREPLIIGVGLNDRTIRLESGNHRIMLFKKYNIKKVPASCLVGPTCIFNTGNSTHYYSSIKNNVDEICLPRSVSNKYGYYNPNTILKTYLSF